MGLLTSSRLFKKFKVLAKAGLGAVTHREQSLAGPAFECLPPFSSGRERIWVLVRGGESLVEQVSSGTCV